MTNCLRKFGIAYLGLTVLLGGISILLSTYADIDLGTATSIAALIGATIWAGQSYATEFQSVPESGTSWKFAFQAFLVATVLSLLLTLVVEMVMRAFLGQSMFALFAEIPFAFFLIAFVFVGLLYILVLRFFFPFAVKTHLKNLGK